jgi:hypothetical protein
MAPKPVTTTRRGADWSISGGIGKGQKGQPASRTDADEFKRFRELPPGSRLKTRGTSPTGKKIGTKKRSTANPPRDTVERRKSEKAVLNYF